MTFSHRSERKTHHENGSFCGLTGRCVISILLLGLIFHCNAWEKSKEFIKIGVDEEYDLAPYTKILDDKDNILTFEDVSSPDMKMRFRQAKETGINFNMDDLTHWLRIELRHIDKKMQFAKQRDWLFDVRRAQLDLAELYIIRDGQPVQKMQSDLRMKFTERPIINANSVFPISTRRGETVTLYLKIRNKTPTFLPIALRTASNFIWKDSSQAFLYGVFFGGMAIMIVYNIFLLVSIRDASFFFYVAYLAPALLIQFVDAGLYFPAFELFPGFLNKYWLLLGVWLATAGGMAFATELLDLKHRLPAFYVAMRSFCLFLLLSSGISYLIPYPIASNFTVYFNTIGSFIVVGLGLYIWYRFKDFDAALLAVGVLFCDIGYLVYCGLANGWIPITDWSIMSVSVGTLLQAATLAFALGERIKRAQRQTIDARQKSILHLKKFRSFFENSPEGIYQLALDGRILSANKSMAKLLGFATPDDLLAAGRKAMDLLFRDRTRHWRSLLKARQTRSEITFTGLNGTERNALHSAKLICHPDGNLSHIEGTLVDLTERRDNELAQRARLKARREREQAKQLTDMKSQFLKDMSYRIRTPLSAIIGFSETLREPQLSTLNRQLAIKSVMQNAQELLQLVNDILDYSKIEAGKMAVETIEFDLMALLQKVQQSCEDLAREKNIYFRIDYRFPLPAFIVSDPTRIRQVLNNLCVNAIRATTRGGVTLQVGWEGTLRHLCFAIEDSSNGLTADEIHMLTHNAVALHSENETMAGSLSIAISRQLTRLLGGEFDIESRVGYGNRFRSSIACRIAGQGGWIKAASTPPSEGATTQRKNDVPTLTGKILLAEDNPVNQKLISRLISKTGASVTVAANGQIALDQAMAEAFDLVLMDINMPVMDGLTATRELKQRGCKIPIFALTAENGSEELQACITAGCQGYLSKPVEIQAFYATLAHYLPHATPVAKPENQQ